MKSAANNREKHHHQLKEESFHTLSTTVSSFFYLTFIALITIFSLYLIFYNKNNSYANETRNFIQTNASNQEVEACDLSKGRWLPGPNASLYTNFSCPGMQRTRNCLLNGRNNTGYLNWKWKPDGCELPRFSARTFLSIVRGKKMAFIGDSLARNQVESLVCLLSTVEIPDSDKKGEDDHKDITWEFREHNFTLTIIWSPFLVTATGINGTRAFNIQLDRVDPKWSEQLPSIDYAVFSSSEWFLRQNYLYEDGHVIGCIYCNEPNMTAFKPARAIGMAFRSALRAANSCKKIASFVRTYTPSHYENGECFTGGTCNRTQPIEREELNLALPDWGYRKMQVEEVEMAKSEGMGKGNKFEFLDVTEMMEMRVDGHPDRYWGFERGRDCLHWCLPGPVDTWNELLLQRIKELDRILLHE